MIPISSDELLNTCQKHQLGSNVIKIFETQNQKSRKIPANSHLKKLKIVEILKKKTKFSRPELEILYKIYNKLTITTPIQTKMSAINDSADSLHCIKGIDRTVFREILYNTFNLSIEDTLIDRMFSCWDRDNDGAIKLEPWIIGLNMFLRGSLREKTEFCFKVYDLNNDGFISKDEIYHLFKNCFLKQLGEDEQEEIIRDLSEIILKKLDIDNDGKISFNDFDTVIQKEQLLLESFGQVLPTVESITAFLLTLKYI